MPNRHPREALFQMYPRRYAPRLPDLDAPGGTPRQPIGDAIVRRKLVACLLLSLSGGVAAGVLTAGHFSNVVAGGSITTIDKFTAMGSYASAVTPPYGFKDATEVEFLGAGTQRGAASFSDARVTTGSGGGDHIHSFQALTNQLNQSGTVFAYRGFAAGPQIGGPVNQAEMFSALNPGGYGRIETLMGLRVAPLNRGVHNFAVLTEGDTPSLFGGQLRTKSGVSISHELSNDVHRGPFLQFSNETGDRIWVVQVNGSNELVFWNFDGKSWTIAMTVKRP